MASIYEIKEWDSGSTDLPYLKNHIVSHTNGNFYYNISNITATNVNYDPTHSTYGSTYWAGTTPYGTALEIIPHFFWVPSYAPSIASEPQVDVVKFGDGYEQRSPKNINSDLLKLDLSFDKRDEAETKAIAHFLHQRGAQEAFAFMPPSPYNSMKKVICRSWNVTMSFEGNYSISASFEEVVD